MKSKLPYILIALENEVDRDALVREVGRHICYAAVEPVENKGQLMSVLEDCSWSDYPAMVILNNNNDGVPAKEIVDQILSKPCFSDIKIVIVNEPGISDPTVYPAAVQVLQKPTGVFELEDVVSKIDKVLIEELEMC